MKRPDQERLVQTTTASGDLFLHPANLVLTATGRFLRQTSEFYDPPRFVWLPPTPQGKTSRSDKTPQFGFRWLPSSFLTVKGNWGRYVRLPTFVELFGNTFPVGFVGQFFTEIIVVALVIRVLDV